MSEPALVHAEPDRGPDSAGPERVGARTPVAAAAGVVSESEHRSLRADIRRLSTMLGRTLAHHGGPELLELVEEVRRLSREAPESGSAEITHLLAGLDTGTAVALTRAFSQYFQLANTAEQLHRSRELRTLRPAQRRPLRMLMQRLADGVPRGRARRGPGRPRAARAAAGVHRAPDRVVAAVVLRVLRGVGEALDRDAGDEEVAARSTCSGRPTRFAPASRRWPTRPNAIGWYLEQLARTTVPELVGEFEQEARAAAFTVPDDSRRSCSARGSAATATATRSSHPRSPAR